jgi:aldehyde dehydrogenase (NAD+)
VVGVITAFNFPCAPWAWNTAVALACGDTVVWKPSQRTSLTALASSALLDRAITDVGAPAGIHQLVLASSADTAPLVDSPDVPLVSATGSERLGREIAPRIAARFGRTILELGGNNAVIVAPSADLDLATRGITFSAAGTAGQRCTTMRRVIVHEDIADELVARLTKVYTSLNIGDPFSAETLVGPLINEGAYSAMHDALERAATEGGELVVGGQRRLADEATVGYYVEPAIVRMPAQTEVIQQETFAPILYVLTYRTFDEAIALHNAVPQGLRRASSPPTRARPNSSPRRLGPTAGSPTSTSAPQAPRSAARSAARRPQAAAVSRARTPGAATCGEPPTPSTTRPNCPWPRE